MMAASMILSPLGLIIMFLIPAITILFAQRPELPAQRLGTGYIGALFALAVIVGAASYVSPQEAVLVWQVPPERYWHAMSEQFLSLFAVTAFVSTVGISLIGIPVLVVLSKFGRATALSLALASVVISTLTTIPFYLLERSSSTSSLKILGLLVISHVILTVGFSFGAKLPWVRGPNAR